MSASLDFTRGPYGEILPPPLVSGIDPDEALAMFEQAAQAGGHPISHMPKRGKSHQGMINVAMGYVHGLHLKQALAGQLADDPDGKALYQAVVGYGEPLSLRPLGLEGLMFSTFAPVLQRIQGDQWQVGLSNQGRTALIEGDAGAVLDHARALYVQWCNEESARFATTADKLLAGIPHSLYHDVWGHVMRCGKIAQLADEVSVQWLGKHDIFLLSTTRGQRIIHASSPERAARIAEGVARQTKATLRYPTEQEALASLLAAGDLPEPAHDNGVVQIGSMRARWEGGSPRLAALAKQTARYMLLRERTEAQLVVMGSQGTRPAVLVRTDLPPNLAQWIQTEAGQMAFIAWAALNIARAGKKTTEVQL